MPIQETTETEWMPRLSSELTACVRWRWQDLQELFERQLEMLEREHGAVVRAEADCTA